MRVEGFSKEGPMVPGPKWPGFGRRAEAATLAVPAWRLAGSGERRGGRAPLRDGAAVPAPAPPPPPTRPPIGRGLWGAGGGA